MSNLAMRSAILAACLTAAACTDEQAATPATPAVESGSPAAAVPASAPLPTLTAMPTSMDGVPESQLCALDSVNGEHAVDGSFVVSSSQPVTFEGWVAMSNLQNPGTIKIILDGQSDFEIGHVTGVERKDVAEAYGSAELENAGFKTEFAALEVPADTYAVMIGHNEAAAVVCRTNLNLVVSP